MKVLAIANRELRSYFSTPLGWLVLTGFLVLTAMFWMSMVTTYIQQENDLVYNPEAAAQLNFTDHLLPPFFGNTAVILLMLSPALSMGLFAEEYRRHTMELLHTSPISGAEVVLGKFLGALGFVAVLLLASTHMPLSTLYFGNPDLAVIVTGYAGLLLLSGAMIAMGMLFSAMTNKQLVAMVLTFSAGLVLWILPWMATDGDPNNVLAQLSVMTHLEAILAGAVRLSDLVWFAGFISVFLLATLQQLESYRWR